MFPYPRTIQNYTELDKQQNDLKVKANRIAVCLFFKRLPFRSRKKVKKMALSIILSFMIIDSVTFNPVSTKPYLILPTATNYYISKKDNLRSYEKISPLIISKKDLIKFKKIETSHNLAVNMRKSSTHTQQSIRVISGGSMWNLMLYILYDVCIEVVEGWYQRNLFPNLENQNGLQIVKPRGLAQEIYDTLSKSEKRFLSDDLGRDRQGILGELYKLDLKYGQIKFKSLKHRGIFNLEANQKGKTEKNEKIVLAFRDSIIDLLKREDLLWYPDGAFQGGTERGCSTGNAFVEAIDIIMVFKKLSDEHFSFLTACEVVSEESQHIKNTNGNFVTEKILDLQKNLTNCKSPIPAPDTSIYPNSRFTTKNSFQSDIVNYTPRRKWNYLTIIIKYKIIKKSKELAYFSKI